MLKYVVLLILLSCVCPRIKAADEADDTALLQKLDKMIAQRSVYQQKVEKKIAELRRRLNYVEDDRQRFCLLDSLFNKYRSFRVDTAMMIAVERLRLAESLGDEEMINHGIMNVADAVNKMGNPEGALLELAKVKRTEATSRDNYFYYLYHTIYLSCYNNTISASRKKFYWEELKAYKDTLTAISEPHTASYITNRCGRLSMSGEWDEAIRLLTDFYETIPEDEPDRARLEYLFSELYFGKEDKVQAKHWLIKSSITDIGNAKKVYMSLQKLAMLLFQEGDVERAYKYITCSLEDINFGKARYRLGDIAEYMPIISAANDAYTKANRARIMFFLIVLSLLVIVLIASFIYIQQKRTKLLRISKSLTEQNQRLQEMTKSLTQMNLAIKESNHIKEEYVGLLFNICSEYIYKRENDRKALLKIVNTGSLADVSKKLKSQSSTSEDFKVFINKFDTIFLSIFPDFVDSFNALLREEERIHLKDGELLTPELRIYALVRLGINDSSKIANFLHYSLQTVYNYRMKMRNKALIPGKDFPAQVQNL